MNALFDRIWSQKWVFFGTFFVVFTLTYLVLLAFDMLPEPKVVDSESVRGISASTVTDETSDVESTDHVSAQAEETGILNNETSLTTEHLDTQVSGNDSAQVILPTALFIPKLNRSVAVLNPTSRTVVDLDTALLEGVVRHPDSATLNQEGNVFILGHSSYLPQVFNKSFQAFNGIQNLEWGDKIELTAADGIYIYRVEKVYRARAQDVTVPIAGTGKILTLATCNSFGSVDDRYIVEAKLIETRDL